MRYKIEKIILEVTVEIMKLGKPKEKSRRISKIKLWGTSLFKSRKRKKRNYEWIIKEVELGEHRVTDTKRISRKEKWQLLQWSKSMKPNKDN